MSIKTEFNSEDETIQQEYPVIKNFNLRCGEIFLTSNGYQFNCANCNDYFINFEYFADHIQKIHYLMFDDTISPANLHQDNGECQISEIQVVPSQQHEVLFNVEQTASNINLSSVAQQNEEQQHYNNLIDQVKCNEKLSFPDESDVEIIEIGECKYTLKKIPSLEDLSVADINDNTNTTIPTISNVQENYTPHLLQLTTTSTASTIGQKTNKRKFEFCCNKVFTNANEYNTHLTNYHKESPYQCSECGKKFLHKDSLTDHMNSIHQITLRYECKKCDLSFSTSESLQYHNRSHIDDGSYKCRLCNEQFTTRILLASHFRIHTRPEPVKKTTRHCKCDICGSTLSRKDNFRRHLRNMHRLENSVVEEIIRKLESGPRYKINNDP